MILMIDDERRTLITYIDDLKLSDFEVRYELSVGAGLKYLAENASDVDLLILDVMMPYGNSFTAEETAKGLITGVRFYKRIRETHKDLPVIILTNVVDEGVRREFEGDPRCWFYSKEDLLPFELTNVVKEVLQTT